MKRFTVMAVAGTSQASCQIVSGHRGGTTSSLVSISGLNNSVPARLPRRVITKPIHHCRRLMRPVNVVSKAMMLFMRLILIASGSGP